LSSSPDQARVLVAGAGAIGALYGGVLARALQSALVMPEQKS